jgi:diketogulonate reductase-like aldo/keto reductase
MVAYNMSVEWFKIGGRRIDAADSYGCEPGIGLAMKDSGLKREDIFIVSKTGPGGLCWPLG